MTLAVNLILEDEECKIEMDKEMAFFFSSAIIIDTVMFKPKIKGIKWDEIDAEVFEKVNAIAEGSVTKEYFKELYHLKSDLELNIGLGWPLLARKDYKNYRMGDYYVGISTVFLDLNTINTEFGTEYLLEEFNKLRVEKGVEIYMVLTHYSEGGEVKRQMMILWEKEEERKKLGEKLEAFEALKLTSLELPGISNLPDFTVW